MNNESSMSNKILVFLITQYQKDNEAFRDKRNRKNFKKLPHYDGGG